MLTVEQVDQLLIERDAARQRKDYVESDRIKDLLRRHGVVVVDTPRGQNANAGTVYEQQLLDGLNESFRFRVEYLEQTIGIYLKTEHRLHDRIAELVREVGTLKYGDSGPPAELKRLTAAINKAWIDRYGGEEATTIAALENRINKIAEDRDCWLANAKATEQDRLRLDQLIRTNAPQKCGLTRSL